MSYPIYACCRILLLCATLSACATLPKGHQWPESIPPRSYFTDYYSRDKASQSVLPQSEYLTWVHRFYFGWELYRRGLLQATDELLATLPEPSEQNYARHKMIKLGTLIAPEWAKNHQYRVINSRHMLIWGNALNEAMVKKQQLLILDKISHDAEHLLAGKLKPKQIYNDRYYPQEAFGAMDELID